MIKRIIFIVFCCVWCCAKLLACDACGCTTSMGIGLLTDYRSNFVRLSYLNTQFRSHSEHNYLVSDEFHQMELSLRYAFGRKIRLMADIAYGNYTRFLEVEEGRQHNDGIRDLRLSASYVLLNEALDEKKTIFFELGGSASIPTGNYDENIHERNLPENFNLGKGAYGYGLLSNFVFTFGKYGIVQSNNYQRYTRSRSDYKFGDQLNLQLTAFREIKWNKWKFIPNLGVVYETITQDRYANDKFVLNTGGSGCFFTTTLNFKTTRWLAGLVYAKPIYDNYSNDEVEAQIRLSCQISYIF